GDYGVPLARFARRFGVDLGELGGAVVERLRGEEVVEDARLVGGYLNIRVDAAAAARLVVGEARRWGRGYGLPRVGEPRRVVVEHTSANPVHPLHIGHARNASLGDTLARLLRARGHVVQTRFYVNDMGRQVAVMVYGFRLAGLEDVPEGVKPDEFIGLVYAITHTLADIEALRRELERLKGEGRLEEYRLRLRELDSLVADAARLRERAPELFDRIAEAIRGRDVERDIQELMAGYEFRRDPGLVELYRRLVSRCLEGFRETLSRLDAVPEVWDWESDLVWESLVGRILREAERSPYRTVYKGALALDLRPLLRDPVVREALGVPEDYEVPPLILRRSDGTTLYTTRDIAYSLKKFWSFRADRVYNVIAAEQRLEQLQVRLALIALGYRREGLNLHHYAYEMVRLPGARMSGRRGRYVTLDELLRQAVEIAAGEVEKRSPHLPPGERRRIAEAVGAAAVRYALLSVSAPKPMTFDIRAALDFDQNSAPYVMYTHARAANILAKARERGLSIDYEAIDYRAAGENPLRRRLVLRLLEQAYLFAKAADELKPEILVSYLNRLADAFNRWYASGDSAVNEPDPGRRSLKLALVEAARLTLADMLELLGIKPLERM
ncbi:MAG: arginine--tRNA ligase, partial [Crenarchaeota archaeon]|nr:arginine--tRNA ligase [Thermoproteota archaeon]